MALIAALATVLGLFVGVAPASATPVQTIAKAATPADDTDPPTDLAHASAAAVASGSPVVATALTTQTSQVTANADGSFTEVNSATPVRKLVSSTWVSLDPTLHTNADGTVSPNETTADVTLSGGGTAPLATMVGAGHTISLTLPMSLPAPTLSGASATYPDVLPDVDLVVSVDEQGGVSEVFDVKTAAAAANPALQTLTISTSTDEGLTLSNDTTGDIQFTDSAGVVVYSANAPTMWDSAPAPDGVTPATSASGQSIDSDTGLPLVSTPDAPAEQAHQAPVGVTTTSNSISLTPDASLLTDSSTTYPVFIDPSIAFNPDAFGGVADWTEVESGFPNQPGWHQRGLEQVGFCGWDFCNGIGVTRTLFQVPTGPLRTAQIIKSEVDMTSEYSPSCSASGDVQMDLFFLNRAINSHTDWNNQPAHTTPAPIQTSQVVAGHSSSCPPAPVGFDITTALQHAQSGLGGAIAFELQSDDETNKFAWRQLDDKITWSTQYDMTPGAPFRPVMSPASPAGCTTNAASDIIGKTDVRLTITSAYAADGVAKPMNVNFHVTNTSNNTQVVNTAVKTAAGSAATLSLSLGTLASGTYKWSANEFDGRLMSAESQACSFTVDTSQPSAPVIGPASGFGSPSCDVVCPVTIRSSVGLQFSPAANSSTPTSYQYQLNGGPAVSVTATSGVATATITLPRIGTNNLSVRAFSSAGTPSAQSSTLPLTANPPASPDQEGDLDGDGSYDLLTVGGTNGVAAGLWQNRQNGTTTPFAAATDIGAAGNGNSASGAATDWNGDLVAHGQFTGDSLQDILTVSPPSATDHTQTFTIYKAAGDGTPLDVTNTNNIVHIPCQVDPVTFMCMTDPITQVVAMGHIPEDTCAPHCASSYPDLFAVVTVGHAGQLWWFQGTGVGTWNQPHVLDDGTGFDWNSVQITAASWTAPPPGVVHSGGEDPSVSELLVRHKDTGEVDSYMAPTGVAPDVNDGWFASANKTVLGTIPNAVSIAGWVAPQSKVVESPTASDPNVLIPLGAYVLAIQSTGTILEYQQMTFTASTNVGTV